jgi:SnoaL-like domain
MHRNTVLLEKFYKSVQDHDHLATAECYHPNATFKDIAFDLREKKMIQAMWHMIGATDLQISYKVEGANEHDGTARWVADYTFTDSGRKVHNDLRSKFVFKDGLILRQVDDCDPWKWGMQALGPVKGLFSWLVPTIRHEKAMGKLKAFIRKHPEYQ